jgi:hypothetical protein
MNRKLLTWHQAQIFIKQNTAISTCCWQRRNPINWESQRIATRIIEPPPLSWRSETESHEPCPTANGFLIYQIHWIGSFKRILGAVWTNFLALWAAI